jgi:hypothetical protein
MRRKRHGEPNLQTRACTAPTHRETGPAHLLAATASQVEKRSTREDDAVEAALDKEEGASFLHPHLLLLPLATKAGQK